VQPGRTHHDGADELDVYLGDGRGHGSQDRRQQDGQDATGKVDIGGALLFAHRRMMACRAQPFEPPLMVC
jgi:hypothetical protein